MGFFEEKKAAAILKHAVLTRYLHPFATKVGTYSPDHRVAFVDGYAGEGRYDGGEEGSPALVLRVAQGLAPGRVLECFFVEEDIDTFSKLEVVIQGERKGVRAEPYCDRVAACLPSIMRQIENIPAFFFLDPFGMQPMALIEQVFTRPGGQGMPATEALINFNAGALRRIAGLLTSPKPVRATLTRMDEACGGQWWRDLWLSKLPDKDAAEQAVVDEYAAVLARKTRGGVWTTDVRNRPDQKPVYHLVFVTRHLDGMHLFGEALSSALEEWRKVVTYKDFEGGLIDPEQVFASDEATLADAWETEIYSNVKALVEQGNAFKVWEKYPEIFGSTVGKARDKHLRRALKRLHSEGLTKSDSKGDLKRKRIEPL